MGFSLFPLSLRATPVPALNLECRTEEVYQWSQLAKATDASTANTAQSEALACVTWSEKRGYFVAGGWNMHRGIRAMIPVTRIVLRASCTVLYLFFFESQSNHLTTMLYKLKLYCTQGGTLALAPMRKLSSIFSIIQIGNILNPSFSCTLAAT